MKFRLILLLMFFLFLIEGTIMHWLIPAGWTDRLLPQFTYIFVLYAALYSGRHIALLLGLGFGLLQDIVYYGHMIGVNGFAMGLCGYFFGLLFGLKRIPMPATLSLIGFSCLLYNTIVYFIYFVFRITQESYEWALVNHIVPSLFLQLAFALAFYVPARRWFEGAFKKKTADEEE
ncbi:rod shape-determining protein MreD [Paenibacillus tarimensis]